MYRKSLLSAKTSYFQDKILNWGNDSKKIFSFVNSLYNNCPKSLPTHTDKDLCNFFSDFYINKLSDICSTISNKLLVLDISYDLNSVNYSSVNNFQSFCSVTNVDIYNLIITLKSSSPLDPLPISLFHNLASFLTPFISTIVNRSLRIGKIPDILKYAVFYLFLKSIILTKKYYLIIDLYHNYHLLVKLWKKLWLSN